MGDRQTIIIDRIGHLVESFYQILYQIDQLKKIIEENSSWAKLKSNLSSQKIEMFNGTIDTPYINKRLKVAHIHYVIGLEPKWYITAFQNFLSEIIYLIYQFANHQEDQKHLILAATKILNFEQQIVLEA
ncbi:MULTISPECIES: protoglobin domain-containing protein [Bacillus]|uniref:protoglobin domain-containing protein n=1 Tax=Bacillus TaxID=1386 RepID=UPI0002FC58BB|nr:MULTISPECIES: protoglobin domain-containing protein [Bacillus]